MDERHHLSGGHGTLGLASDLRLLWSLQAGENATPPQEITGAPLSLERFEIAGAKEPDLIIRFGSGGLISYGQADGTFTIFVSQTDETTVGLSARIIRPCVSREDLRSSF